MVQREVRAAGRWIEKMVLGAVDVLMWPSTNWRQWRLDRLDRQIAEVARETYQLEREIADAIREGDRLKAMNRDRDQEQDLEIARLRRELIDLGIDPDQ